MIKTGKKLNSFLCGLNGVGVAGSSVAFSSYCFKTDIPVLRTDSSTITTITPREPSPPAPVQKPEPAKEEQNSNGGRQEAGGNTNQPEVKEESETQENTTEQKDEKEEKPEEKQELISTGALFTSLLKPLLQGISTITSKIKEQVPRATEEIKE